MRISAKKWILLTVWSEESSLISCSLYCSFSFPQPPSSCIVGLYCTQRALLSCGSWQAGRGHQLPVPVYPCLAFLYCTAASLYCTLWTRQIISGKAVIYRLSFFFFLPWLLTDPVINIYSLEEDEQMHRLGFGYVQFLYIQVSGLEG